MSKLDRCEVLVGGIRTARITQRQLAERMVEDSLAARDGRMPPKLVFASNGSVIAGYNRDASFRRLIDEADLIDADGMPLVIASRLFHASPIPERIATTDFIHVAAEAAASAGIRFYFFGGTDDANAKATIYFQDKYPSLQIVGRHHGYVKRDEEEQLYDEILAAKTDVVWVGLGSPLQETFSIRARSKLLGVGWIRTCGGLFDHYSGTVPRAPMVMQRAGLEWLFRTWLEPRRLGPRYFRTNLPALYYLALRTRN